MIKFSAKDMKTRIVSNRDGFGDALVEIGEMNPNVVVVCADLAESTRVLGFKEKFPERFVEVGVAEQNAVTIASGLAAAGKIPFVVSYAAFSPGRNWEQIRTTICYNHQSVKIVGSHAGLTVGPDGATHQALEDITLMRVLPNMTVIAPCDYWEAKKATIASARHPGPVYLRLSRDKTPILTKEDDPFEVGRAYLFHEGRDVTLISTGSLGNQALRASDVLQKQNISVEVINVPTIKPLDEDTIIRSAKKTKRVITLEDHQVCGGLGGAVTELLSSIEPTIVCRMGVNNQFGQSGNTDELLREYKLDTDAIVQSVNLIISR